ncbi:uncharacterized protein LOC125380976 [Haliotis rufescens]|uniref:uncharacterized protein LOC125380976 n=1 Tax=Haliotis rufescens TaxID=6454 RepID=UPI00201F2A55|nr:uncharacterized protein LOC125380976 [Haliotis rufescens]
MALFLCVHVLWSVLLSETVFAATTVTSNITSNLGGSETTPVTTPSKPTRIFNDGHCELISSDSKIYDELSEALKSSMKLITFNMKITGSHGDMFTANGSDLFRPNLWIRSTSRQGRSLLMLDDNFEVLSLSLLGIGVTTLNVELEEKPSGCMTLLTNEQRANVTRYLVVNDFSLPGPGEKSRSLNKDELICNMRIVPESGRANFVYHCCHIDSDGNMFCEDVHRDLWINVLLTCILIIKVLVVLYSPSFIPETLYRKKFTATDYTYSIPSHNERIKIVTTSRSNVYPSEIPRVKFGKLEGLNTLKDSLTKLQTDKIYELSDIHLSVESGKLLSDNYVPVSVVKMLYENVFRCHIRRIPFLKSCCDAGMCDFTNGCKVFTWYRCMRIFAKLVLLGLLAVPWIIRLIVYYTYEADIAEQKRQAAERLETRMQFNGSFIQYLTPLHWFFVAVYIIVLVDFFVYGIVKQSMKNRFKFILRKSLQGMRERSDFSAYGWTIGLALLPFKRFGIIGFLLVPLYWIIPLPIVVPLLAFYTFPALNFSIRLFIFVCPHSVVNSFKKLFNFMKQTLNLKDIDDEEFGGRTDKTKTEVLICLFIIIVCLTSFWSLTFLLMECLTFFVEVGVYTLMGIIVNSRATMQYVTVLFLIGLYAKTSFNAVYEKYLTYHKIIRGQLLSLKHDEMKEIAKGDPDAQENTVFRVRSSDATADNTSGIGLDMTDGSLRWKTKGLLVFLNSMDRSFTPERFFFETINMNHDGCPGKLWKNTWVAFYSFMKIMVFLFFVVTVVLAFGTQFSTTNQMLATLAGGFIPFVFRKFFISGSGSLTVDTESIMFLAEFNKTIAEYTQKWSVADKRLTVSVDEVNPMEKEGSVEEDVNKDSTNKEHCVKTEDTSSPTYRYIDIVVEIDSKDVGLEHSEVHIEMRESKLNQDSG